MVMASDERECIPWQVLHVHCSLDVLVHSNQSTGKALLIRQLSFPISFSP